MSQKILVLPFLLIFAIIIGSTTNVTHASRQLETRAAIGTAFTYQGILSDGDSPASGVYDFQFALYDALTAGSQVGSTITKDDLTIADGLLFVELDFGNVYDGASLYLEIRMRDGASTAAYTTLSPRQTLTPSPYAIHASSANSAPWSGLTDVPVGLSDGDDDALADLSCTNGQVAKWNGSTWSCADDQDTDTDTLATLTCSNGHVAKWNGSAWSCADDLDTDTDTLATLACSNGQVAKWNGSAWNCADDVDTDTNTTYSDGAGLNLNGTQFSLDTSYTDDRYWSLTGNSGTVHSTNFLGTTDAVTVTMKVDDTDVLLLQPDSGSPSVMLPVNAGNAKTVNIGERYRDNAVVAWARVNSNANIFADFGVVSAVRDSTGYYIITISEEAETGGSLIPIAMAEIEDPPVGLDDIRIVSINQVGIGASAVFEVFINDGNGNLVDNDFVFMVTGR